MYGKSKIFKAKQKKPKGLGQPKDLVEGGECIIREGVVIESFIRLHSYIEKCMGKVKYLRRKKNSQLGFKPGHYG